MSEPVTCDRCGTANAATHKFCVGCGAGLSARPTCTSCGKELPAGARFCTSCGAKVGAGATGAVEGGEWQRPPGEIARVVPPKGILARLAPGLGVRVPLGSVAVVLRDGTVTRVFGPGERTTLSTLRELAGTDVRELGLAALETWLGERRITLVLVDRRPIPLAFTADARSADGTRSTAVAVEAGLVVGGEPEALGAFLARELGDAEALAAETLYLRHRTAVEQAVAESVGANPADLRAAERAARQALGSRLGASGLRLELSLSPRETAHRLDLRLPDGEPLLTKDGAEIELDLALSARGPSAPAIAGPLSAAAARFVRGSTEADLADPRGLALLEGALSEAAAEALAARGHEGVSLTVVDLRTRGGQWKLGARAAMARARDEATVGREWLKVREDALLLEAATAAQALREERQRRADALAARKAAVDDDRQAAAIEDEERALARRREEAAHGDRLGATAREAELAQARAKDAIALGALRRAEEDRQRRAELELEAHGERLRREARVAELSAMAEIEAAVDERDQRHRLERMGALRGQTEAQMIAMQAHDLASKEHGGAFAEALGRMVDGEAARKERERADARLDAKDERATRLLGQVLARGPEAASCAACGARLAPGARFCGGCGASC